MLPKCAHGIHIELRCLACQPVTPAERRQSAATQIIAALRDLAGADEGKTGHGKDAGQWRYKAQQWLLMEPE